MSTDAAVGFLAHAGFADERSIRILRLGVGITPFEALRETVQRPGIVGVTAEILAEHDVRPRDVPLLEQQRSEGVPGRLHPTPWLVVVERIVAADRLA